MRRNNSEQIVVKRADERQLYSITAMTLHYFPYTGFSYREILRRLGTKSIFYYVALYRGHTVGFVDFELREKSAQILGLAVLEEFRGKGIASMLLGKAVSEIKKISKKSGLELKRIDLLVSEANPPAQALYKKFGFIAHGKLERKLWEQDILVYTKYLC